MGSCALQLLNCKRRLAHLVWNVVVTKVCYAFCIPVYREEVFQRRIKELLRHIRKTVFGITVP